MAIKIRIHEKLTDHEPSDQPTQRLTWQTISALDQNKIFKLSYSTNLSPCAIIGNKKKEKKKKKKKKTVRKKKRKERKKKHFDFEFEYNGQI